MGHGIGHTTNKSFLIIDNICWSLESAAWRAAERVCRIGCLLKHETHTVCCVGCDCECLHFFINSSRCGKVTRVRSQSSNRCADRIERTSATYATQKRGNAERRLRSLTRFILYDIMPDVRTFAYAVNMLNAPPMRTVRATSEPNDQARRRARNGAHKTTLHLKRFNFFFCASFDWILIEQCLRTMRIYSNLSYVRI